MNAGGYLVGNGLPLRFSASADGDLASRLSDRIEILVDGEVLEEATSWDAPAGEVVRRRRGEDGALILDRGASTFETLRGRVEVRWIRDSEGKIHG